MLEQPRQTGVANVSFMRTLVYLVIVTPFLVWSLDNLWSSASVDLAHHYALVSILSEKWALPAGFFEQSLVEMNHYPRLAHGIAAILGKLLGSPFLGMQLLTQLSALMLWSGLGFLLLSLPRRAAFLSLAILAIVLLAHPFFHFEIFGTEVIEYFFFSQLVAQAAMVIALIIAMRMEKHRLAAPWRYGFLLVCIYVTASIHILPAAELVAVVAGLAALEFWYLSGSVGKIKSGLLGGVIIAASGLTLIFHPGFKTMREISQHNGGLFLSSYHGYWSLTAYCLLIIALSIGLLCIWIRMHRTGLGTAFAAVKVIGMLGLAIAGVCVVQLLALKFGHGSEYAIKKYLYGLNTILLFELILLPILLLCQKPWLMRESPNEQARIAHKFLLLPMFSVLAFQMLGSVRDIFDTSDIVTLERHMNLVQATMLPPPEGRYVYVLNSGNMPSPIPRMIAYMMSISVFKTPRSANLYDLMLDKPLSEPAKVYAFLARENSELGRMSACRWPGSTSMIVVLNPACLEKQTVEEQPLIVFTDSKAQKICTLSGFSFAEQAGQWTDAIDATISCPIPQIDGRPASFVRLSAGGFVSPNTRQRLQISINGANPVEYVYDAAHADQLLELKLPNPGAKSLELKLHLPDAVSPSQLGLGSDQRRLGIFLRSLEFTQEAESKGLPAR
jgi:hypothetical protein